MEYRHIPVMLSDVIRHLDPQPGDNIIDCTFGGGGYGFVIAKMILPNGKVLGIDLDETAIDNGRKNIFKERIENIFLVRGNFKNLLRIAEANYKREVLNFFAGVVFDLGLSSAQLDDRSRGFAFKANTPLDMAFGKEDDERTVRTNNIVNKYDFEKIDKILKDFGEEKYHRNIAQAIIKSRKAAPIETTGQLVEIIRLAVPGSYIVNKKIHFATRTFQALRIATNDELENLEKVLPQALDLLKVGGKIIVISYHSLEDRIIKNFLRFESRDCICPPQVPVCNCGHQAKIKIITRKPSTPAEDEIASNRRARSAKMRVAKKI